MEATTEPIRLKPGEHVVHFYRDDAELAHTAGTHLLNAVRDGAAAIVIATAPHLCAFRGELLAAGIDVEDGSLTLLDAHDTLAEIKRPEGISRAAFQRVVGTVVRRGGEDGRPLHAYGEMVDLLWRAGDVPSAIELEGLWNELIAELQFSLLCAYHSEAVEGPEHEHALRQVCQLHSAVSSANERSRRFEPAATAPWAARGFLDETLQRWGRNGTVAEDARLVLSELVTNAVVHARSPLSVAIRSRASGLRLSVSDDSMMPPTPRSTASDAAAGGYGLMMIGALAREWGVNVTARGKTVWAEL